MFDSRGPGCFEEDPSDPRGVVLNVEVRVQGSELELRYSLLFLRAQTDREEKPSHTQPLSVGLRL